VNVEPAVMMYELAVVAATAVAVTSALFMLVHI
jgi:hypothetical protein